MKALHDGYALVNANVPAKQAKGRIFISKAVILLCAAKKNREWNSRETLEGWREKVAILGARALERAGHKIEAQRFRHGHETLEKQRAAALARGDLEFVAGLDREPSRHVGVTATAMERKGIRTERGDLNRAVHERAALNRELKQVNGQIDRRA